MRYQPRVVARRQAYRLRRQGRQGLRATRSTTRSWPRSPTRRAARSAITPGRRRGRYLAFSMSDAPATRSIYIWSEKDGQVRKITDELFNAENPAWDPDGNYLFYLSDREFAPQISTVEFNLRDQPDDRHLRHGAAQGREAPLPARSDEVADKEDKRRSRRAEEGGKAGGQGRGEARARRRSATPIRIDFDGLGQRVARVPVEADNYGGLAAKKGYLIYVWPSLPTTAARRARSPLAEHLLAQGPQGNDAAGGRRRLRPLARTAQDHGRGVGGIVCRMLDAGAAHAAREEDRLHGGAAGRPRARRGMGTQIFNEVWRRYRDWFYVENMHGYDWEALRDSTRRCCSTSRTAPTSTT